MDEQLINEAQWEELHRACVIIGECMARAAEEFTKAMTLVAANVSEAMDSVMDHYEVDSIDELRQMLEKSKEQLMAELAEDPADIIPVKKLPRPPKKIMPANKANYTANRPQRRARSSCYIIKR